MQLFDYDQDGVLSKKEGQGLLRCLGLAAGEEELAALVLAAAGADTTHHSLSFNEFLTLVSVQRRSEPTSNSLLTAFTWVSVY